jgi:hypothetical protein
VSCLNADGLQPMPGELVIGVAGLAELHYGVLVATLPDARAVRLTRLTGLQMLLDPFPADGWTCRSPPPPMPMRRP